MFNSFNHFPNTEYFTHCITALTSVFLHTQSPHRQVPSPLHTWASVALSLGGKNPRSVTVQQSWRGDFDRCFTHSKIEQKRPQSGINYNVGNTHFIPSLRPWWDVKLQPNQMSKDNSFCLFMLGSAHTKCHMWPWPWRKKETEFVNNQLNSVLKTVWDNRLRLSSWLYLYTALDAFSRGIHVCITSWWHQTMFHTNVMMITRNV